ncbi:hypothetical protein HYH03_016879 [Edaphochlamys debaryana]|uniref:Uncharacterized protein n=1 Tax=Edaphochlamys debaryana TaxID=47281 RepID=A0A835XGR7_9CHLO|nr:hypothetical protein HYH03_016879 [Edaphochlamys debaryana]|eukprot:KAG2484337.1 hypothetical protein HYH03_016879 [Edaphochlamys debaryana]
MVALGGGGGGTECFRSLRHEFLVVHGSGDYCGMEFIVEPALRQHFAIPHPSPEYALVLSHLPEVFVGGSCRLAPIVQLMCALMADSFAQQGLALPPWRKEQAMLSKWMPQPHRLRELALDGPQAPSSGEAGVGSPLSRAQLLLAPVPPVSALHRCGDAAAAAGPGTPAAGMRVLGFELSVLTSTDDLFSCCGLDSSPGARLTGLTGTQSLSLTTFSAPGSPGSDCVTLLDCGAADCAPPLGGPSAAKGLGAPGGGGGLLASRLAADVPLPAAAMSYSGPRIERCAPLHPAEPIIHLVRRGSAAIASAVPTHAAAAALDRQ